jgi:hypothetical protein
MKDTYQTFHYKTCFVHTCENRITGKTEVQYQIAQGEPAVSCRTITGAKRAITKELARRAKNSDAVMERIAKEGVNV